MNNTRKKIAIFLLIFIIGSITGIVGYSSAKVTTFEECENSWLFKSITFYDYADIHPNEPDEKCELWTGKSFLKYSPSQSLFFPTEDNPATALMAALLSKESEELKIDNNGCLRFNNGDNNFLIVWPYGFSIIYVNNTPTVVDKTGKPIVSVGDKVMFGGGADETPDGNIAKSYSAQLPNPRCPGPYWITGGVENIINIEK